jgi:hypothetical protein
MCPPFFTKKSQPPNLGKSLPGVLEAPKISAIISNDGPHRCSQVFIAI